MARWEQKGPLLSRRGVAGFDGSTRLVVRRVEDLGDPLVLRWIGKLRWNVHVGKTLRLSQDGPLKTFVHTDKRLARLLQTCQLSFTAGDRGIEPLPRRLECLVLPLN